MFKEAFERLNNEQKQAVTTLNPHLLVVAPAGTGKTNVITLRTAYLMKQGVAPENILCLTFTNKAAKEMRDRITRLNPQEITKLTVKTFHAFCYTLISQEKEQSHFSFPCTILDEVDSDAVLHDLLEEKGLKDEPFYFPELRSFIENIKRFSLGFERDKRYTYSFLVKAYWEEQRKNKGKISSFLSRYGLELLIGYIQRLKEINCVDFMDLVVEAHYLLEQEQIQTKWQGRYHYIQVDEMQDTSIREYNLIKKLAQSNHLALFGDFNQTIYEWRGSSPKSMITDFKKDFSPVLLHLKINYRSTQLLLQAANDYIASSALYPSVCLTTSEKVGDKIHVVEAATKSQEIQLLAQLIQREQAEEEEQGSLAILTRNNEYAKNISHYFNHVGIPCTLIEDTKFFRKKEIKDILDFVAYGVNERNNQALSRLCKHPYMGMGEWLLKRLEHTKDCYMYLHDWFHTSSKDPYMPLWEGYKHDQLIVLDVESTGLDTTHDEIVQIAAICYGEGGVKEQLNLLVKPTRLVGSSYYVHGFSDELLQEKGQQPEEALKALLKLIAGKVVIGHNVNYDLQIIRSSLERYKLPDLAMSEVYDTLDLAYKVYPTLENYKLETLSKLIKTKYTPNHNALYDILATSEILTHLLFKIQEKRGERLEAIEAYYPYLTEYKEKLNKVKVYLLSHPLADTLAYLMNDCQFKDYYDGSAVKALRELYRIADAIYEEGLSLKDNHIQLLTYASLHYSELEQTIYFKNRIPIITIHQAKGLEFDKVYVAGCNERTFPSAKSIRDNHLEEERRLFYVAMTRPRRKLTLTYHNEAPRSYFVDTIAEKYKEYKRYSQMN
ncbi:hypothetical protein CS063_07525 [Sporanaerobium hydrogeniformans]|uniref:Uncharacterized protein n=1 Tax=Sporanaerobium hydrogeniformans TaxID=3072179 RepID=A0AC61DEM5_9FIRM|nr:3'-5' exonuclease [Sporanaerobium hydrogeniformans]PHV71171.1 hypothetical protein CS063_07525 [Sporanaerobium hydrogeniformans]